MIFDYQLIKFRALQSEQYILQLLSGLWHTSMHMTCTSCTPYAKFGYIF